MKNFRERLLKIISNLGPWVAMGFMFRAIWRENDIALGIWALVFCASVLIGRYAFLKTSKIENL